MLSEQSLRKLELETRNLKHEPHSGCSMPSTSSTTPSHAAAGASPPTVLVVDDEPTARMALAARLKRLGYRVIEAGDGKAGLEALRRERPDLTILDWMMPEMDGTVLLRAGSS